MAVHLKPLSKQVTVGTCFLTAWLAVAPVAAQSERAPETANTDATPVVPADPAARKAEEARLRASLDEVRKAQREVEAERAALDGERGRLLATLRDAELAISGARAEINAAEAEVASLAAKLNELEAEEQALKLRLAKERAALAALVRTLDVGGRHYAVRALFAADTLEDVGPLLAYGRYLDRARRVRMAEIDEALAGLVTISATIRAAQESLEVQRRALAERVGKLERANADRGSVLAALEGSMADQAARLADLQRDAAGLDALLARLTDAIADVPARLAGSEPFSSQRGRLRWPVRGEVSRGPGTGVRIAAAAGTTVEAVGHGRVAYADWMRGYGLLVIVDHGGGFMSLYGNQRALLKAVGDWVEPGDPLGEAGDGGAGVPEGIWFELRRNGVAVDPGGWLARQ